MEDRLGLTNVLEAAHANIADDADDVRSPEGPKLKRRFSGSH
jgi:hypothetical protein